MTGNGGSDPRVLGRLRSVDGTGVARMEDRFATDIDDLWSALIAPDRLARWYGQVEGDLRLGGEFRVLVHGSGWEGTGRVEACDPPRRLVVKTRERQQQCKEHGPFHGRPMIDGPRWCATPATHPSG